MSDNGHVPMSANPILGPRVPPDEYRANRARYFRPMLCFVGAMLILILSMFFPYWQLTLKAPQFPNGLHVSAYIDRIVGQVDPVTKSDDLDQLEGLNHYVGMPSLKDGAKLERSISVIAIVAFAGLLLAAVFVHSRWALLAALPALLWPVAFLVDLQYWLWNYGHSLDPRAPLAGAVGEFTPHIFGSSKIAQFDTMALPGAGLIMAAVASILVGLGLWFHRQAYRPLVDATAVEAAAVGVPAGDGAGAATPAASASYGTVAPTRADDA